VDSNRHWISAQGGREVGGPAVHAVLARDDGIYLAVSTRVGPHRVRAVFGTEIGMTVVVGIAAIIGMTVAARWRTSVRWSTAAATFLLFVVLQVLAFRLSLIPYTARR
jgi:hypothetical protein